MLPSFDVTMLACHMASCTELLLFFAGALSAKQSLVFEMALLALKSCLEFALGGLTPDLVFHHLGMGGTAYAVFVHFPTHTAAALFPQTLHIPLALQYARRLSGGLLGCTLDRYFSASWVLVVVARCTEVASATVIAHSNGAAVRWVLYPCVFSIISLDIRWTMETFQKRTAPKLVSLIVGAGTVLGVYFESDFARATWAFVCAVTLLTVCTALASKPARSDGASDGNQRRLTTD